MEDAPVEILHAIFQDLSREDIFRIRFINKWLASASAPFLFKSIKMWLGLQSLEGLTEISEHVRRVVCSTLRFIDHGNDQSAYEAELRNRLTNSSGEDALAVDNYVSAYQGHINAQRHLTESGQDLKNFTDALQKLPKLDSIAIEPIDSNIGSTEIFRAFEDPNAERLVSFDGIHFMPMLFRALHASGIRLRQLHLGTHDCAFEECYLETMCVEALEKSLSHPEVQKSNIFSELQEIELHPEQMIGPSRSLEGFATAMCSLLRNTPSLRSIEFYGSGDAMICPFSIFSSITWPKLRKVHMSCISSSMQDTVRFVARHAETLEDVVFRLTFFTEDTWFVALRRLRAAEFKKLKYFLVDIWGHPFVGQEPEIEVHNYLLHITDVNPLKNNPDV